MIMPTRPERFNILPTNSLKKISPLELIQILAQEAIMTHQEDFAVANNRARCFMRDLYGGKKSVQCQCGKIINFKNEKLQCPECGRDNDRIEFVEDYQAGRFIKTIVDIKNRTYALMENQT